MTDEWVLRMNGDERLRWGLGHGEGVFIELGFIGCFTVYSLSEIELKFLKTLYYKPYRP